MKKLGNLWVLIVLLTLIRTGEVKSGIPYLLKTIALREITSQKIAQEAIARYDKVWKETNDTTKAYKELIAYLNRLPEDLRFELAFCTIINKLNRSDIFIAELTTRYQQNLKDALSYFSLFCPDARSRILSDLVQVGENLDNLQQQLLRDLALSIRDDYELADIADIFFPVSKETIQPKHIAELANAIEKRLLTILEKINKQQPIPLFDPEIIKQAQQFIELIAQQTEHFANEELLAQDIANFNKRWSELSLEQQDAVLAYILTNFGIQNMENFEIVRSILDNLYGHRDLSALTPEDYRTTSEQLIKLYKQFTTSNPITVQLEPYHTLLILDPRLSVLSTLSFYAGNYIKSLILRLLQTNQEKAALDIIRPLPLSLIKEVRSQLLNFETPKQLGGPKEQLQFLEQILRIILTVSVEQTLEEEFYQELYEAVRNFYEGSLITEDLLAIFIRHIKALENKIFAHELAKIIIELYYDNPPQKIEASEEIPQEEPLEEEPEEGSVLETEEMA